MRMKSILFVWQSSLRKKAYNSSMAIRYAPTFPSFVTFSVISTVCLILSLCSSNRSRSLAKEFASHYLNKYSRVTMLSFLTLKSSE